MTPINLDVMTGNRHFYDQLWESTWLLEAEHYNTWPLVERLLPQHPRRIEIAPGLRPRLPIEGTTFVDLSQTALNELKRHGGSTVAASIEALPVHDQAFDLICALDILEHVQDDEDAIAELSRISADNATLLLSTPLHPEWWTPFDEVVGHYRRYTPSHLLTLLHQHGFTIRQSAHFGMQPKSSRLVDIGMWFLTHQPTFALWWYNRIFPIMVRRQQPLALLDGLPPMDDIGAIFLVCQYCPT